MVGKMEDYEDTIKKMKRPATNCKTLTRHLTNKWLTFRHTKNPHIIVAKTNHSIGKDAKDFHWYFPTDLQEC